MNFEKINSATKYPSIDTYHTINPKNGGLLEEAMPFSGKVLATEKVNGGNGRVIVMSNGDWFIGSREEILYAKGDRIVNPGLSIVPTLLPLVDGILGIDRSGLGTTGIEVYFFEVYGHGIGGDAKNYTKTSGLTGARLFDVAWVPNIVLDLEREQISSWRQRGGQKWYDERYLKHAAAETGIELAPRVAEFPAEELPQSIEDMHKFLHVLLPLTNVALDETGLGRGEGIVFRTEDRSTIAKARFQDYERTLRRRAEGKE